ncbi:MAG: hypothetical protein D6681_12230, partial [Calditrichaeota bacterium]
DSSVKLPLRNLDYHPPRKIRVALVLSGGGARGLAHIGVLKALEEAGISFDLIVGTSIGSIVGGFYAAGFSPEEIRRIIKEVDWKSIFNDETRRTHLFVSQKSTPRRHLIQFRMDGLLPVIPSSISQGQRVVQILYNRLVRANFQAANDFDNLRIPFRAVATDLISGRKVVLKKGDLAEAINASSAFPLLLAPVEIDSLLLVDGGITDNLPVDVALQEGADVVIAVDATSTLRSRDEIDAPWELADQVTTIMMFKPTAENRRLADIVITPDLGEYKGGDFQAVDTLIARGYQAAQEKMDSIRQIIREAEQKEGIADRDLGWVASVKCVGSASLPSRVNLDFLHRRSGRRLTRRDVINDLRTLYQTGYFQNVEALVRRGSDTLQLVYRMEPFPPIRQVTFRHHNILPDSIFSRIRRRLVGQPLNIKTLTAEIEELQNRLIRRGYALAQVREIRYHPESRELEIELDEGFIADIRIVGNRVTRDFVILREFPLKIGDVFQASLATRGIENIYSTNLFHRVLLNLEQEDGRNVVVIKVKERKYMVTRLGAHYSFERRTEGFMEILQDNLLGWATQMSLFGKVGEFSKRVEASFFTVRLLNTLLTARASFYYDERRDRFYRDFTRLKDYTTIRRGGRFMVGQHIGRLGLISLELRIEDVNAVSPDPRFPIREDFRLRTITLRSVVDKRDRLPFPEKGIYNRWYWETGSQFLLGSEVPYTKVFLGLEGYYPLTRRLNYHPFLKVGTADLTLPFTEFFFVGGEEDFPGLYEREQFGRQVVQAGLEVRYRLPLNLPIEAYLTTGYSLLGMWERPDEKLAASDLIHSIWGSLAFNSLLGPVKLTYARLPDYRNRIHFSLGFDF